MALIRPYGDAADDGGMQLSFTLPVSEGALAREAARQYCLALGLESPVIAHSQALGGGFTFFVVFARSPVRLELEKVRVIEAATLALSKERIEELLAHHLRRPLVVVGACTGSDAHTVGLDAILNYKGYKGDHGLESFGCFAVHNLGSQVSNERLVAEHRRLRSDAILVSQIVTQRDGHLRNLTELVDLLEAEGVRDDVILVAGGPRLSHELAMELGFDAGFGPDTRPSRVAAFLVQEVLARRGIDLACEA